MIFHVWDNLSFYLVGGEFYFFQRFVSSATTKFCKSSFPHYTFQQRKSFPQPPKQNSWKRSTCHDFFVAHKTTNAKLLDTYLSLKVCRVCSPKRWSFMKSEPCDYDLQSTFWSALKQTWTIFLLKAWKAKINCEGGKINCEGGKTNCEEAKINCEEGKRDKMSRPRALWATQPQSAVQVAEH